MDSSGSPATTASPPSLLRPVVICGPSGVGKGTLIDKLFAKYPGALGFSVSHTTRQPRPGEQNGVHYHFTTVEDMEAGIARDEFLEYANVHGKYYGTSVAAVESVQKVGKVCVLDIDVQGVALVKQSPSFSGDGCKQPAYVFVAPPSLEELERRLRGRGTESEDAVKTRLGNAAKELEYGQTPGNFDKVLVNDDLDKCFAELVAAMEEWYPHLKTL